MKEKTLTELVGKNNILGKEELIELQNQPIKIYRTAGRINDALIYSEDDRNFTLIHPEIFLENKKPEIQFIMYFLLEGTIARQPEKHINSDEEYLLSELQGRGFINKGSDPEKYAKLIQNFEATYQQEFTNAIQAIGKEQRITPFNRTRSFKRFYETTRADKIFSNKF